MLPRIRSRTLAAKLRRKRQAAGLTLKQVSALLGGKPVFITLHNIETGKTQPSARNRKLVREFLALPYQVIESKPRLAGLK